MMRPNQPVGIAGYGVYIPRYRIAAREIARVWAGGQGGVPVEAKSVPGPDEDTITMSIEAARNALARANLSADRLSAVWVGSESHPYSVKPSGTIVAEALGTTHWVSAADWEFACKAGSEALTAGMGMVGSGMAEYVLAIGADTAQGRPGDALEYTAAAGAAALVVGPAADALALMEATCSYVSDTPDFFRRADRAYPVHGGRFTGEPAYFGQIRHSTTHLLEQLGTKPADYTYAVFHQPRQHLLGGSAAWPLRGAGCRPTGRHDLRRILRLWRRLGRLCPARHRPDRRAARECPTHSGLPGTRNFRGLRDLCEVARQAGNKLMLRSTF